MTGFSLWNEKVHIWYLYTDIWIDSCLLFHSICLYTYIMFEITMTRKSGKHLHAKHWTAVSILLGLISRAHRDLHHRRSNQQPHYEEAETLPQGHRFMPHISDAELTMNHDLLIWHSLYVAWTGGPVVEFRLLHTVVVGSISSGGDHGVPCWWDLIRSKQLFSAPYVARRCLPDFLAMVISNII